MAFYVGQKVVCRNKVGFATSTPHGIKKGEVYTITQISTCICGKEVLELKEATKMNRWCGYLDKPIGYNASYYSYRFEPLVGSWVEELLEKVSKEHETESAKAFVFNSLD